MLRYFPVKEPAGVGGLRYHQVHIPVQRGTGTQQGHAFHTGASQRLSSGGPVDEDPPGPQFHEASGEGAQLSGGRGTGQLHIAVRQGAENSHRSQGGHHVGEVHHLQGGVAQRDHAPGGGEQIAGFQVQIGLLGPGDQVGAFSVPAHRGEGQPLVPQLGHQAAHGGGLARVLAQADHGHGGGIPHQRR